MEEALKSAMKSGDDVRKRTIRMALSAVKYVEVDKGTTLDEAAIVAVLQKELKSREETIEEARRAGRSDLIAENQAEIGVLREFLPQPLGEAELEELVRRVIQEAGAAGPADMGKVMKVLVPRLEGRAGGNEASALVRKLLQSG